MIFYIRKLLFILFRIVPIQPKKIVFSNFYGNGYADNPKYMAEVFLSSYPEYRLYWICRNPDTAGLPSRVHPIKPSSISSIYHLATAKVWIDNCRKGFSSLKRKEQIYIQTWHGFGPKRCEKDVEKKLTSEYIKSAQHDSQMCDLFISFSHKLTEIYRQAFWYNGEILETGYPRNEIFFTHNITIHQKVRDFFHIDNNTRIVLYAPTFRQSLNVTSYLLDFPSLINSLSTKWGGEWAVLVRMHPNICNIKTGIAFNQKTIFNASNYLDMQELLYVSNVLITDYSSSIIDFFYTGRPAFTYAPDLVAYKQERDFYFDLTEMPAPLCTSQKELEENIAIFNQDKYTQKKESFIQKMGILFVPNASEQIIQWLFSKI